MTGKFGLNKEAENTLIQIFKQFPEVHKVILYGSRAKGTYHERSDVDLVIAESETDRHVVGNILYEINESDFPYTVDIQILENIKNPELRLHIDRVGKVLYEKHTEGAEPSNT